MADVQLEHGYTKIANELLEHMATVKLSPIQYRVIFVIWRYTYGFNRKEHHFSLSFIGNATGYDQRQLQRELAKLEERNIIHQKVRNGVPRIISFNKKLDEWVDDDTLGNSTKGKTTLGKVINGNSTKGTLGRNVKGTFGNSTKEEINNLNKNLNKQQENEVDVVKNNPIVEYEKFFGFPSAVLIQDFNYWIDESQFQEPEAILCEVIKQASKQAPRNAGVYVKAIIKKYHDMELFTLDAVLEYNRKFEENRNGGGHSGNRYRNNPKEDSGKAEAEPTTVPVGRVRRRQI
ncbi:replication protein [Niallia taxi]|nr:replication protein [Niallia taxi]MDE5054871.1 replication protein [Niallia taxi]